MAWLYLFIASIFEIAWTFSLKFLDVKKVLAIPWLHFFGTRNNFFVLAPLLGYIFFGIANIIFFSVALKHIPAATAMAVWLGTALVGVKLVDIIAYKQPYNFQQFIYFALIIIGIVGLKRDAG